MGLFYLFYFVLRESISEEMLTVDEDIARLSGEYAVITVILDRFEKILHFPVDAVFYHLIAIQSDWIDETARDIT